MNFIEKIYCLDIPSKQVAIELTFDPEKNIAFLTGHNGVGKTKILKAIHESICHHHKNDAFGKATSRIEYLISMTFSNSEKITSIQKNNFYLDVIKNLEEIDFKQDINAAHDSPWNKSKLILKKLHSQIIQNKQQEKQFSINPSFENEVYSIYGAKTNIKSKIPNSLFFSYDITHYSGDHETLSENASLDRQIQLVLERFKKRPQADSLYKESQNLLKIIGKELNEEQLNFLKEIIEENRALQKNRVLQTLNSFFRETHREIIPDEDEVVKCKLLSSGEKISWRDLSKGEKNIIFLCFSVYFHANDNIIFLIDEPETALHISWQEKLIQKLTELSPKSQFIIATHSPSIIFKTEKEQYFNLENIENE